MSLAALELDLDVFSGPFDLLLTLVLREEVDLLELQLADVVLAYLDHLEQRGELDLETATEFIVLIAALLELKSRLMLSGEEEELLDIEPEQAAEELLARMLDARRYRAAAAHLGELLAAEQGVRFRRRAAAARTCAARSCAPAEGSQDPSCSARRSDGCCTCRPRSTCATSRVPRVSVAERLAHLRGLLRRGAFSFDEAVRGADRMTVAVTLFALLELYKRGEADWEQQESFGEIAVRGLVREAPGPPLALAAGAARRARRVSAPAQEPPRRSPADRADRVTIPRRCPRSRAPSRRCCSSPPTRSASPSWPTPRRPARAPSRPRWRCSARSTRPGRRGMQLRELAGGFTFASDPDTEDAARRLLSRPRASTLTPAQAETLAIVAYLQPISRPEITRIRGVSADSATATLLERGLIEEAGSSQFGAVLYRTTTQFLKLFGLRSLDELPDVAHWDPTPEEQAELRERLLRAGEARAGGGPSA